MQIADHHAFSGFEEKGPEQGGDLRIGEMMQKSGTENEIAAPLPQRGSAHITLKDGDLGKMESSEASDFADRGVHVNGQHAERISRSSCPGHQSHRDVPGTTAQVNDLNQALVGFLPCDFLN